MTRERVSSLVLLVVIAALLMTLMAQQRQSARLQVELQARLAESQFQNAMYKLETDAAPLVHDENADVGQSK